MMTEEVEVKVHLPKGLIEFLSQFMDEEEMHNYLEDCLKDAVKADLGEDAFCMDLIKRALRKFSLNPEEWIK